MRWVAVAGGVLLGLTAGAFAVAGSDPDDSTAPAAVPVDTSPLSDEDLAEPLCEPTMSSQPANAEVQTRLEPLLAVVVAYGREHRDSWSSYGLAWTTPGDGAVVASFTRDIAVHRAELEELVDPDDLLVCRAVLTDLETRSLQDQLTSELAGRFNSVGPSGFDGRVTVGLFAADEDLAAELIGRYGDQIAVTVGLFQYPMPDPLPPSQCRPLPAPSRDGPTIEVEPIAAPVASGDDIDVDVTLRNDTDHPMSFTTGPAAVGTLTAPGGAIGLSVNVRAVTAAGYLVELEPGESTQLAGLVGTGSCDPAVGYVVPPGDYDLVVWVTPAGPADGFDGAAIVAAPLAVAVT